MSKQVPIDKFKAWINEQNLNPYLVNHCDRLLARFGYRGRPFVYQPFWMIVLWSELLSKAFFYVIVKAFLLFFAVYTGDFRYLDIEVFLLLFTSTYGIPIVGLAIGGISLSLKKDVSLPEWERFT